MTSELSAIEIHTRLLELQGERALASIEGLAANFAYVADLDGEIEATTCAYVGAAVTEIATLRAELRLAEETRTSPMVEPGTAADPASN